VTRLNPTPLRILAIDPFASGIGFVVLSGSENLIDWGLRTVRGEKNPACLRVVEALILRYSPNVIIVENCQAKGCYHGHRIKDLIEDIAVLARARKAEYRRVTRLTVYKAFSQYGASTKHQIAAELAEQFPELARHLPRPRKPWTSEDARMSIFDALALATVGMKKR
jgi:hypothetical protein